jgi:hypothetical protein
LPTRRGVGHDADDRDGVGQQRLYCGDSDVRGDADDDGPVFDVLRNFLENVWNDVRFKGKNNDSRAFDGFDVGFLVGGGVKAFNPVQVLEFLHLRAPLPGDADPLSELCIGVEEASHNCAATDEGDRGKVFELILRQKNLSVLQLQFLLHVSRNRLTSRHPEKTVRAVTVVIGSEKFEPGA